MDPFTILFFLGGLILIFIFGKILLFPIKLISKLLINGVIGGLALVVFNLLGGIFNLSLDITPLNAIIVGFLGVPGVIVLLAFKLLG